MKFPLVYIQTIFTFWLLSTSVFLMGSCDAKRVKFGESSGLVARSLVSSELTATPTPLVVAPGATPPPLTSEIESAQDVKSGETVVCRVEYPSTFNGEIVIPTFWFYNTRSTEPRLELPQPAGVKSASYVLRTVDMVTTPELADKRGDQVFCKVTLVTASAQFNASESLKITISDSPPTLSLKEGSLNQLDVAAGASIEAVTLVGDDPDGDDVSFIQETSSCVGITLDANSGTISGSVPASSSPAIGRVCSSSYRATSNSIKSLNAVTLTVDVPNHAPSLSCTNKTQSLGIGEALTQPIQCSGSDVDAGSTLTYSLSGCSTLAINSSTGAVTGALGGASCQATVTVTDGNLTATDVINLSSKAKVFKSLPQNSGSFSDYPSGVYYWVIFNGSKMYLGTDAGLGISTDGGTTISTKTTLQGLGSNRVVSITLHGNTLYAATHGGGISYSTDGGQSFVTKTTANGLGSNDVAKVFVDPLNNRIYAATGFLLPGAVSSGGGGVSISTDGGFSFTNRTVANSGLADNVVSHVYAKNNFVYAATSKGLSVSTDWGNTFSTRGCAEGFTYSGGCGLTNISEDTTFILPGSNNRLYVGTVGGLAISTDGANTFEKREFNILQFDSLVGNAVLSLNEQAGKLYVSTSSGLSISTNNGATFDNINSGFVPSFPTEFVYSAAEAPDGKLYAATTKGLGVRNAGALVWSNKVTTTGLLDNEIWSVASANNKLYAGTSGGLGISSDNGASFSYFNGLSYGCGNTIFQIHASGQNVLLATSVGLCFSTDEGQNFSVSTVINNKKVAGVYVVGSKVFAATDDGLFLSNDSGATFAGVPVNFGGVIPDNSSLLSVDGNGANNIVVGTETLGAVVSTDGGSTWQLKNKAGSGIADNQVNYVKWSASNMMLLSTPAGLSISTDGGASFVSKTSNHGLASSDVQHAFSDGSTIYVSTASGLSISTNGGSSFTSRTAAHGLSANFVHFTYKDGTKIYVGTSSGLSVNTGSLF